METTDEQHNDMLTEERKEGSAAKPKLSLKALKKLQDVYNKRGIIYISRIPPHLVGCKAVFYRSVRPTCNKSSNNTLFVGCRSLKSCGTCCPSMASLAACTWPQKASRVRPCLLLASSVVAKRCILLLPASAVSCCKRQFHRACSLS